MTGDDVPVPVRLEGPALAVGTCARRLAIVPADLRGFELLDAGAGSSGKARAGRDLGLSCRISWHGPASLPAGQPASEASIQALSGLMDVHGREQGQPRRLGIEIASVAAGMLAGNGVLAALIGRSRGWEGSAVETSALEAALLSLSQYIARTTCDGEGSGLEPPGRGPAPGPPFPTADGRWVELETLSPEAWKSFWGALGVEGSALAGGWNLFGARFSTATCSMPAGFHEATASRTLDELDRLAHSCGMSLCPVRSYAEVLHHPGLLGGGAAVIQSGAEVTPPLGAGRGAPTGGSDLPLGGIEVVEATSRIQGPLAGLLLQMLGARVIRVEPPGGDVARMVPPLAGGSGAFFLAMNRRKVPVEIDLARPTGRAELAELVAGADVFLHNWRPGKAVEWGLDADRLLGVDPRLVYCCASGWGEQAPACPPIGMEFQVQAFAGLGHGCNPEDEAPFPSRLLLTDFMGGLIGCEGVLSGLYRRTRTGLGAHVESSLLGGAMALQAHVLEALARGEERGRRQGRPVWGRLDRPLQAADGAMVVSAEDDDAFLRLARLCGLHTELGGRTPGLEQLVAEQIASRSAGEWDAPLAAAGIPCAPCTPIGEVTLDDRLSGLFESISATARVPATPWRFPPAGG